MRESLGWSSVAVAATLLLAGSACAPKISPRESIAAADYAVRRAQEQDADRYAPRILRSARQKLEEARAARLRTKNDRARRLADEAAVEAQLAEALAGSGRAADQLAEVRRAIEDLRTETERALSRETQVGPARPGAPQRGAGE